MMIQYSSYFTSYLLLNLKEISKVNKIILFGSVARGEATSGSDIDIFIDIKKKSKKLEKNIENIIKNFYSSREAVLFKARGIDNKINAIIGNLEEWKDLKNSIESDGVVLYGKYFSNAINGKKYIILSLSNIKKNRGAFLNKLYGVKINKKFYVGLIEQLKGKKIGKSAIMIPIENKEKIFNLIKKYQVNAKIFEVYM